MRTFDNRRFRVLLAELEIASMAELARRLGLSPSYIRLLGKGMLPPQATQQKVALALGVQPAELWPTADRQAA